MSSLANYDFTSGESTAKGYLCGTHRLVAPEVTLSRLARAMPVMGITRIANVTDLDIVGIPVVMVCRPNSRSLSVSQGKGLDLAAAKASGLMESFESYHAERITLALKIGSVEELRYTHRLVDVAALPRSSDRVFDPRFQLLWIEGQDLMTDEPVWVPYEMVHLNYTLPLPTGHGCFAPSSNGLASGNHLLEAVSHGICEVVERDATTLWHLLDEESEAETRLDLDSVDDPDCRAALDKLDHAGVAAAVWETTSDVEIPAFLCRIVDRGDRRSRPLRPATGMGCHPAREIALLRAITEAAQSRLTFISGARDDLAREHYDRFLSPASQRNWRTSIEALTPGRRFRDVPTWAAETFEEDVAWELERLEAAGIERTLVVDLTKPEFGLPVVRVIIPGLEALDASPNYVAGKRARTIVERLK